MSMFFAERFQNYTVFANNYTVLQNRIVFEPFCYFRLYRRKERRIRPSNQRGRLVRCIRRSCSIMRAGECLCFSERSAPKRRQTGGVEGGSPR